MAIPGSPEWIEKYGEGIIDMFRGSFHDNFDYEDFDDNWEAVEPIDDIPNEILRQQATKEINKVPFLSDDYDRLRWLSFNVEERKKFISECLSVYCLASSFGYTARTISDVIKQHRIPGRIFTRRVGKGGRPVTKYHPNDVGHYLRNKLADNIMKLLTDKRSIKLVFLRNNDILRGFREIIQEIDNDRNQMQG